LPNFSINPFQRKVFMEKLKCLKIFVQRGFRKGLWNISCLLHNPYLLTTKGMPINFGKVPGKVMRILKQNIFLIQKHYLRCPLEKSEMIFKNTNCQKKVINDAKTWRTVGITFQKKWNGDPRYFLEDCSWDSLEILERLRNDKHLYNSRLVNDYPFLRGPKIGPLWLRMLRDNVGIDKLENLELVPIPVDIHVARATLATGIIRGNITTKINELFKEIRDVWYESVKGLKIRKREMISLDVDEPLWHLSKYGCTKRDKSTGECPMITTCEARDFCVRGTIKFDKDQITLDT